MTRTAQLYVKDSGSVLGPFSSKSIHEMVTTGLIQPETAVSPDGDRWVLAKSIKGLFQRPGLTPPAPSVLQASHTMRDHLRNCLTRIEKRLNELPLVFHSAVMGATVLGMCASGTAIYTIAETVSPYPRAWVLTLLTLPPALLVGFIAGHVAGKLALQFEAGFTPAERRCLALHVPWSRVPERWPPYLKNWIYGGDWLHGLKMDDVMPYVRVFLTGPVPESLEEEVAIWEELTHASCGAFNGELEVGRSARELAMIGHLPDWTREIEPGSTLASVRNRLGNIAHNWSVTLLNRASARIPELLQDNTAPDLNKAEFEFQHIELHDHREALMVVIRPKPQRHYRTSNRHVAAA